MFMTKDKLAEQIRPAADAVANAAKSLVAVAVIAICALAMSIIALLRTKAA
jgi:hypothetical protein